jgi:hypothetical protein
MKHGLQRVTTATLGFINHMLSYILATKEYLKGKYQLSNKGWSWRGMTEQVGGSLLFVILVYAWQL